MNSDRKKLQPAYKIVLFDGETFEECTIDKVYDNYITLKEHNYYSYFFGERENTLFIELESGYSYDTHNYLFAIKGDSTDEFKNLIHNFINKKEETLKTLTEEIDNLKDMEEFIS